MNVLIFLSAFLTSFGGVSFSNAITPVKPEVTHICAGPNLDFDLINKTGYTINGLFVAPTKEKTWGENILGRDILKNGETLEISFDPGEKTKKWDIYVTWDGYDSDEDVFWTGFDLSAISEITLFYDAKKNKTWAEYK
jgi:hypothetical protein